MTAPKFVVELVEQLSDVSLAEMMVIIVAIALLIIGAVLAWPLTM